ESHARFGLPWRLHSQIGRPPRLYVTVVVEPCALFKSVDVANLKILRPKHTKLTARVGEPLRAHLVISPIVDSYYSHASALDRAPRIVCDIHGDCPGTLKSKIDRRDASFGRNDVLEAVGGSMTSIVAADQH